MRYSFGHCILDTVRYELLRAGHVVVLEPQAFRVLAYFLRHSGQAVAKQDLLQALWPGPSEAPYQEYSLRNCLHKIRQAIGDAGTSQTVIETLRGYGYRFTAAVTLCPPDSLVAGAALQRQEDTHAPSGPSASTRPLPGRRQLTVLSCALVADPTWTRLDTEDVQTVIQAFYRVSEQVLQHFNGSIVQYDSEELLVYCGYPMADEAAAQQAVRAGLALVEAVQQLGLPRDRTPGRSLAVRVGIHTGPVVVEEPMPSAAPALMGATLTLAKRVQVSTPPATVVLSAATYNLVQGYFTCQALDEYLSIGDDAPLGLYRVLGASGRHTRFEVAAMRGLTPLVGCEAELALLLERWAQVQDGMGHVIMLCGEPGIGKSRLVQALKDRVEGDTGMLIECRGIPYYQHSALYPVITHLQRVLDWEHDEAREEKLHKLEVALAQHPLGLAAVVPLFAALLSLPLPERYPPLIDLPAAKAAHAGSLARLTAHRDRTTGSALDCRRCALAGSLHSGVKNGA